MSATAIPTECRDSWPRMADMRESRHFSRQSVAIPWRFVFATTWQERAIVQRVIAQISWRQNIALMERLDYPEARLGTSNKPFKTGIPFGWVFRASGQEAGQFVRIRARHPPGIRNPATLAR